MLSSMDFYVTYFATREWIQEIKRMMMMYSTHGLFLTCTQKVSFIFTRYAS
jgi:hypothetical protein